MRYNLIPGYMKRLLEFVVALALLLVLGLGLLGGCVQQRSTAPHFFCIHQTTSESTG